MHAPAGSRLAATRLWPESGILRFLAQAREHPVEHHRWGTRRPVDQLLIGTTQRRRDFPDAMDDPQRQHAGLAQSLGSREVRCHDRAGARDEPGQVVAGNSGEGAPGKRDVGR